MAAANIGYSGAKSEFQSSTVKKNTDFYRNYVSGKLTDENFKWPECPWKFVTKNHLIGAIQSPDRSEIEYDSNEVPQSPCSSNSVSLSPRPSTSNQLMSDMVKMIKGAKEEAKSEVKVETPTVPNMGTYGYIFPYGYPFNPMNMTMNPAMMPMPNMLPNMPMVGMPPHAPLQSWGGATPAQNPAATPMHTSHSNPLAIEPDMELNQRSRPKQIPLESSFDSNVEHNDPRSKPRNVPRKMLRMYRTSTTSRFIETYKRTHRNVTNDGVCRVVHPNSTTTHMYESMRKKIQTQEALKNAGTAEDFQNVSDSDDGSDSDLSPTYEPIASNDGVTINGVNPESIVPSISSENDTDASHVTAEFHPVSKKDSSKEKSSRSTKKRRRSRSSGKHEKHRNSEKHSRVHSSTKHERTSTSSKRDKHRSSDKHERPRGSDKRERSRSSDKPDNKRKRVAPLLINKRNNTVISKDETEQLVRSADKENKAPACIPAYVPPSSKEEPPDTVDESGLEHLFSGPIRTSGPFLSLTGTLDELFRTDEPSSPTASQPHHAEKPAAIETGMTELHADVLNLMEHNNGICTENELNGGMDEMETLNVSQSHLSEMIDDLDNNQEVKTEESMEVECHNSGAIPTSNNDHMPNQANSPSVFTVLVLSEESQDSIGLPNADNKNEEPETAISTNASCDAKVIDNESKEEESTHEAVNCGEPINDDENQHDVRRDKRTASAAAKTEKGGLTSPTLSQRPDLATPTVPNEVIPETTSAKEIDNESVEGEEPAHDATNFVEPIDGDEKQHDDERDKLVAAAAAMAEQGGDPLCPNSPTPSQRLDLPTPAAQEKLTPDSKTTSALLAAKQKYPSDRPLKERLENATFEETIELLSSDDEEEDPNIKPNSPIVMMSCYSVESSDEE